MTVKEPDYFFLYNKPFTFSGITLDPPLSWILLCGGTFFGYLLCVFVLWPAMRPTTKEGVLKLEKLRNIHNLLLCLYSGFCCAYCAYDMHREGILPRFLRFFTTFDVSFLEPMLCAPVNDTLRLINYTFVASKIWEMLDTFFIVMLKNDFARGVLRAARNAGKQQPEQKKGDAAARESSRASATAAGEKKPPVTDSGLTVLGVYHHSTTFWLFLLVSNFEGTLRMGLLLNGAVHAMMYAHYYHQFPRALVPLITASQIAQLAFVTACWGWEVQRCKQHSQFVERHWYEFLTPYGQVPVFLVLFIQFFVQRFVIGAKQKAE